MPNAGISPTILSSYDECVSHLTLKYICIDIWLDVKIN